MLYFAFECGRFTDLLCYSGCGRTAGSIRGQLVNVREQLNVKHHGVNYRGFRLSLLIKSFPFSPEMLKQHFSVSAVSVRDVFLLVAFILCRIFVMYCYSPSQYTVLRSHLSST